MATSKVYRRVFNRTAANDTDVLVTDDYIRDNFTDVFGQLLADESVISLLTYKELAEWFWKRTTNTYSFTTFAIADGAFVPRSDENEKWFSNHVRFLTLITPKENPNENEAPPNVFVVGSLPTDGSGGFLQVASWNGQVMRYYAVENLNGEDEGPRVWTYQGDSWGAFADGPGTEETEYLGPFNGHVNGACIMKELHKPWYHWYTGSDPTFVNCLKKEQINLYKGIRFLTGDKHSVLTGASVRSGEQLEPVIKAIVSDWYTNRVHSDFYEPAADGDEHRLRTSPVNTRRWMAHLLLTTTINVVAALSDNEGSSSAAGQDDVTTYTVDWNHFFNSEMLSMLSSGLIPSQANGGPPKFDVGKGTNYDLAKEKLQLALVCEDVEGNELSKFELPRGTLGGGKQTRAYDTVNFVEALSGSEGMPFVILQPSYEDSIGVLRMQKVKTSPVGLLSAKAFRSVVMLDYWNPVFSWRRGVLMQYVPPSTSLLGTQYDLEDKWVAAIRQSRPFTDGDVDSPEYQFIQLYDNDNGTKNQYEKRLNRYISKVREKMKTADGIYEYLQLAEARRRIYRPLPLDEFGVQLPYARAMPGDWGFIEMREDGTTAAIPPRGKQFLLSWTFSLAGYDPHLIPATPSAPALDVEASHVDNIPTDVRMANGVSRCPVMSARAAKAVTGNETTNGASTAPPYPTWNDDIRALFVTPKWVSDPGSVGLYWRNMMLEYSPLKGQPLHLDLFSKQSVEESAVTIYQHLRSKSMPITQDPTEYWPDWALETFRLWANQGYRTTTSDPIVPIEVIASDDSPFTMRVRKDILSLSDTELQTYREKLDTVLRVGELYEADGKTPSKWQELGLLHAEWCLHYQEATFLWHRAFLRYVEELIDFPIPYWNGFAADTSERESPYAGIPQIFLDDEYTNSEGEVRKNPLRWALAYNGKSKGGGAYVQRAPELVEGRGTEPWKKKVDLFKTYHQQIAFALSKKLYSLPQYWKKSPMPWANIPVFTDHMEDWRYPTFAKEMYFDGLFEQAHDNYHGWVGPDMADNTYTAFDPIFLSYHCNMDRIVERYLRAQASTQPTLTFNFPLRPFVQNARALAYADPREYIYTTIGDMQKDVRALNYLFAPPVLRDFVTLPPAVSKLEPKGGVAVPIVPSEVTAATTANNAGAAETADTVTEAINDQQPYVIFAGVTCTRDSYEIDVFVRGARDKRPDPILNADYIGRITRLGMGSGRDPTRPIRNASRCVKPAVTRVLRADGAVSGLLREKGVDQVVRDLTTGLEVAESEWKEWPGFVGRLVWG